MASLLPSDDHNHCSNCFHPASCNQSSKLCPLTHCPNNCHFTFHFCKSQDHLSHICPKQYVSCLNRTNGCKLKVKRSELGTHLAHCPASVIECNSFKVRRLINRNEKHKKLKWPCPINQESNDLAKLDFDKDNKVQCENVDINDVLLEQDYER